MKEFKVFPLVKRGKKKSSFMISIILDEGKLKIDRNEEL